MSFNQAEFEIRCEWGLAGLRDLAPISDAVIIVDVLSFSTALDVATSRGGIIFPYPLKDDSAATYAASLNAQLASASRGIGFSLSPASLTRMEAGCRLVLPSPNGAALSFSANHPHVLAACLRNATAAAALAARLGSTIAVIPAGEIRDSGDLRPSLEDLSELAPSSPLFPARSRRTLSSRPPDSSISEKLSRKRCASAVREKS